MNPTEMSGAVTAIGGIALAGTTILPTSMNMFHGILPPSAAIFGGAALFGIGSVTVILGMK